MAHKTAWNAGILSESDINTYLTHEGGAWTTWTPTVQQGVGVTVTVNHAVAYRSGRLIIASFRLTVTGSGTAGQGVGVSLPENAARTSGNVGYGGIFDTSATLSYTGIADLNSVNNQIVYSPTGLGVAPSVLGSAHFTAGLASGDIVTGNLIYEAAT